MQQSNSRFSGRALAVCSQVQAETCRDQVEHISIARGVALKGDRLFTGALQLGRPVNAGDISLKWTPKGTEVEAKVFVCGRISAPAGTKPFQHAGGKGNCRAIRFASAIAP